MLSAWRFLIERKCNYMISLRETQKNYCYVRNMENGIIYVIVYIVDGVCVYIHSGRWFIRCVM